MVDALRCSPGFPRPQFLWPDVFHNCSGEAEVAFACGGCTVRLRGSLAEDVIGPLARTQDDSRTRAVAPEKTLARNCREAGATVRANVKLREMEGRRRVMH